MTPSDRQQAILDEWNNTNNNILISAVAGSGKTSTLLLLLENCEFRTLFVAFNKSIQEEIQERINLRGLKQGKAMTLHSLGLSAIRAGGKRYSINNNKNWNLIKKVQTEFKMYRKMSGMEVSRVSYTLIDMNDVSRMYLTDDISKIKKYMLSMDKSVSDNPRLPEFWEKFVEIREESYEGRSLEIDFADMIYLPAKWDLEIPVHPYYLMIDECQDLNLAQHKLIDNLINQGSVRKWIAVGDRNQAIYGFAGANSNSFNMFFDKSGDVKEMPLDICYRCASDIVESANEVYDVMEAAKTYTGIVSRTSDISSIKPNSMVICRNTNPLFYVYFKLLAEGKPCYINGNEIMSYLLKFLRPYSKDSVYSAMIEMQYKLAELEEKDSDEARFQKYIFEENFNNFKIIADSMCKPTDKIEYLVEKLKHLFEDKANAIMLCTIHKSKGLEADVVYILNENLIPSKFAKSSDQLRQEQNLRYVARTRAKEEMYFLDIETKKEETLEVDEL